LRLYLDTSALVKLYVDEDGSSMVREWVDDAEAVATSILAFVEGRAAFARRHREKRISSAAHARLVRDFAADWDRYLVLEATELLIRPAGKLTEIHRLRAYHAIHLASAKILREKLAEPVSFASWDARLVAAARKEGLEVMPLSRS
jgi:predicted nucleic acid-binding protein